MPLEEGLDP